MSESELPPLCCWQVGAVRITRVTEQISTGIGKYVLPQATSEELRPHPWLYPDYVDEQDRLLLSIHALLVESAGKRIVVDTCVGNHKARRYRAWNHLALPFLERLASAGADPEQVDFVLCTHLHVDHVGWNTRWHAAAEAWVPTFPRARYLFGQTEWRHWQERLRQPAEDPDAVAVIADSVQPVLDAGLADLVETDHAITSEVRLVPTPGHTPGHVAVRIHSRGAEAVITGDLIHHPCQCVHPEWSAAVDFDADLSRATRRAFLADCADRGCLVIGSHFAGATAGRVMRAQAESSDTVDRDSLPAQYEFRAEKGQPRLPSAAGGCAEPP